MSPGRNLPTFPTYSECPLPVLDREWDEATDLFGDELLRTCGSPLYVEVQSDWTPDGAGERCDTSGDSTRLVCQEGHVLLIVYNDTNADVAEITPRWIRAAVVFRAGEILNES